MGAGPPARRAGATVSSVPTLSVVVPTFQRCASVNRLLVALSHQTLSATQYEVVVSIDGSTDGTREMASVFRAPFDLRVLWQPNGGRAGACNAGVRVSRGPIVVLLDDDMEPCPSFLAAHLEEHALGRRRGVLGAVPIHVDADSSPVVRFVGTKFNRHLKRLAEPGREIGIRNFYSGNFSIPRDVFLGTGGFDESFRIYGNEDVDLAARLLTAGVELGYSEAAAAIQHYEKDFMALARDHIAKGKTAVLCASKRPEWVARMRLGNFRRRSRKWWLARAALLAVSDHSGRVPAALMRLIQWSERRWPGGLLRYYPFVLDYFFWFGARSELRVEGMASLKAIIYERTSGQPSV